MSSIASLCRVIAILSIALPADAQTTTSDGRPHQLEEIVVRARKRAELLEDTPVSVTALSESRMRATGVTRLNDIQSFVPNLFFTTPDDGIAADIRIRGIGTPQAVTASFDPGVGVYVDGVFLPRTIGTLVDVLDIQQVEVLRGPQGTLFGKNNVGGAVLITTKKPGPDTEGFVLARPGNFGSIHSRAMLNVPLAEDLLFARVAFAQTHDDGYFDNRNLGKSLSNRNGLSFLGSIRLLATQDLTIDISGTWSREHTAGRGSECAFVQETDLQRLAPGLREECSRSGPFFNHSEVDNLVDVQSYGTWGTFTWEVGELGFLEDVSLKSISSWREQKPRIRVDADSTQLSLLTRSGVGGSPTDGAPGFQRQISQEAQINTALWEERVQLVAGAFGFWENGTETLTLNILPDSLDIADENFRRIDNWSWAVYGQTTVEATDWLSLTTGIRFTKDKKGLVASTRPARDPGAPPTQDQRPAPATFSEWTPTASVALTAPESWIDFARVDHLMSYFTWAKGFRGGGFNGLLLSTEAEPFGPETLDSYEVGIKTIALDDRIRMSLSGFIGKYDDIQVTSVVDLTVDPDNPIFQQRTINAAKATTWGVELEGLASPISSLQINGSIGFLDTKYDRFQGAPSDLSADETLDRAGESFNSSPALQTNLGLQWELQVEPEATFFEGFLTPRIDWSYQSDFHALGPEVGAAVQHGYNLLNARLAYTFNEERIVVALWSKNLTDEAYFNAVTPLVSSFGIASRLYGPPRTYGAELSYRF